MLDYKIVLDSCGELPPQWEKNPPKFQQVPLTMHLDGTDFVDSPTLDTESYLQALKHCKSAPKSSCPSPDAFADAFSGAEHIFVVTLSSKLSGSYNSALNGCILRSEEGHCPRLHVFDSKSASAGQMLIALKIHELAQENCSFEEIVAQTNTYIKSMHTFFVLENLEVLIKSGRMSKITGVVASALTLRPIMTGTSAGEIRLFEKARGSLRAFTRLVEIIGEACPVQTGRRLAITHCKNAHQAEFLKAEALKRYSFEEVVSAPCGGLSSMYAYLGGVIISF